MGGKFSIDGSISLVVIDRLVTELEERKRLYQRVSTVIRVSSELPELSTETIQLEALELHEFYP